MKTFRIDMLKRECDDWNATVPVGTKVRYYPVMGSSRSHAYTVHTTISGASILGDHTVVIWLEGRRGCVALSHCKVDLHV